MTVKEAKRRRQRLQWAALAWAALQVFAAAGCTASTDAAAAGGGGAGAGPLPEYCVDIRADPAVLDDPDRWISQYSPYMARTPFWRDARGIHIAWHLRQRPNGDPIFILSSFDPSGAVIGHQYLPVFPAFPQFGQIWAVAGSADGQWAAAISYEPAPNNHIAIHAVVFGHLDQPDSWVTWVPWTTADVAITDVGWDGEAFAVHAVKIGTPQYFLKRARLSAGQVEVVTDETIVGTLHSIYEESFNVATDAETGITRVVTTLAHGVWFSGHLRDGTPLSGTVTDGGVAIPNEPDAPGPSSWLAVAPAGQDAMLAWHVGSDYTTNMQAVKGTDAILKPIVIPDEPYPFYPSKRTLARYDGQWWMGFHNAVRVDAYTVNDSGVTSRHALVVHSRCSDQQCDVGDAPDLRNFSSVVWGDELWFGFWDLTDGFTNHETHPVARAPYRIVRVKEGCIYPTMYDIHGMHGTP